MSFRAYSRKTRTDGAGRKPDADKHSSHSPGQRPPARVTWEEGVVDPRQEHFELRYGERQAPVARVGRDSSGKVMVQYLVEASGEDPRRRAMLNDVGGELTHYLFGAVGANAWEFARFHCDTPANLASRVHWSWRAGA